MLIADPPCWDRHQWMLGQRCALASRRRHVSRERALSLTIRRLVLNDEETRIRFIRFSR